MQSILDYFNGQQQAPVQQQDTSQDYSGTNLINRIQELLGAREPDQGGTAQDILSARFQPPSGGGAGMSFQPSVGDYAQGVVQSALGKPTLGGQVATERTMGAAGIADKLAQANYYQSIGTTGKGEGMMAAARIKAEHPEMSFTDAYMLATAKQGQGVTMDANGQISTFKGAPETAGAMAYGKEGGKRNAEMGTAAGIERQKIVGKGEITPLANQAKGQNQLDFMASKVSDALDRLDMAGGAVNTENGAMGNAAAYMGNTPGGQFAGKLVGSDTQSIRNEIAQMQPLLINAIRQSTGMSAKAMDSNAELKFYLQAITDPTKDIQSQKVALTNLVRLYGSGGVPAGGNAPQPGQSPATGAQPPDSAVQHLRQNPQLAPDFEAKYGVSAQQYLQ